jgi:carbamate kinase
VPYVYINFNKPDQQAVEFLNLADTKKYLDDGMFAEGSMAPKSGPVCSLLKKAVERA